MITQIGFRYFSVSVVFDQPAVGRHASNTVVGDYCTSKDRRYFETIPLVLVAIASSSKSRSKFGLGIRS
jgi:hypothetical protein